MNVASLDICKELFEKSGWRDTEKYWYKNWLLQDTWQVGHLGQADETTYPAYDLGYLLRKLPDGCTIAKAELPSGTIHQYYNATKSGTYLHASNTPEDATCLLAIELFEQGILTKE